MEREVSRRKDNKRTRNMILVALFAALTAVGAFIRIPVPYVPFTLQFVFCALAGIILGAKLGALSQMLYVFIGLIGVPVFTQGGGIGYIFQPTFGYLIGFIVGAYVIGKLTEKVKDLGFKKCFISSLIGLAVVYLFGVVYMYFIYRFYLGNIKSVLWVLYYGVVLCVGGDTVACILLSIGGVRVVKSLKKAGLHI